MFLSCLSVEVALQRFSVWRLRSSSASALTSATMEKSNIDQGDYFWTPCNLKEGICLGKFIDCVDEGSLCNSLFTYKSSQ